MDELVIKYYRKLCREGFEYCGSLENPTVLLDTIGEKLRICGMSAHYYMNIYIDIDDGVISDIKYLCTCDPTANVVVEVMCQLAKGKSITEAAAIMGESFTAVVGSRGEDFLKRAGAIIELLKRGLARYNTPGGG